MNDHSAKNDHDGAEAWLYLAAGLFGAAILIFTAIGPSQVLSSIGPWGTVILEIAAIGFAIASAVIGLVGLSKLWRKAPSPPRLPRPKPTPRAFPFVSLTRNATLRRGYTFFIPLLLFPLLVGGIIWAGLLPDACDPPTELIVATTPDSEPIVRAVGDAFAAERAANTWGDCRPVNVQVYAAEGANPVEQAIVSDGTEPAERVWDQSLGPMPHVWIPDSSVDAERVARAVAELEDPGLQVDVGEPTRQTPLIVALPREHAERLPGYSGGNSEFAYPFGNIREAFDGEELRIARADPAHSPAALLHTTSVYFREGAIDEWGTRGEGAEELEISLERPRARGELELLCQVAESVETQTPMAALTTEAAFYRVRKDPLGSGCPPGVSAVTLVPLYSPELPTLDHPFVRIRPTAVDDGVEDIAREFEGYLQELYASESPFAPRASSTRTVSPEGVYISYRNQDGVGGAVTGVPQVPREMPNNNTLSYGQAATTLELSQEFQGYGTVLLVVDTSTSMRLWAGKFETALAEAEGLVNAANDQDVLGLWSYPQGADRSDTGHQRHSPLRSGARRELHERLRELRAIYESTPLRDVIADGAEYLHEERSGESDTTPMLVVLTEGVGAPENAGLDTDGLADRLDGLDVQVRILAVGDDTGRWGEPDPCRVDQLPELDAIPEVACVAVDPDRPGDSAYRLLLQARRGQ